ncbi:hypothetical protein [Aquimarina sp. MMG016]|uniref:hypothetical protein n=1 Tax=Aquimarina sp. MMG016 TaxID=2822690 RepID=UPI001B3A5ADA|nr:hypothetical protein [Aquimarina sp. MMG016]MBQ4821355.1 hypothetical protein [Aquimarina sp. MMG016]
MPPIENTITLETGIQWTTKWRQECPDNCRAFLIPKIDLIEVLQEKHVVNVRAYMGIDDDGIEKLIIVGVDADGKDVIGPISNKSATTNDEIEFGYLYDFTDPCPNTCDNSSPLNG